MQKFGRNYKLTITPNDGQSPANIVIEPPFTLRFWVRRDVLSSVNQSSMDIYNLSYANRKRIFQDRNNLAGPVINGVTQPRKSGKLEIGYGTQLSVVWQGDIWTASSYREGVDIITRIESLTGIWGIAESNINIAMPAGSTLTQVFQQLASQIGGCTIGYISSSFPPQTGPFIRSVTLSGNPWTLIQQYIKNLGYAYIDNNKVYIMATLDKVGAGVPIPVLNSASGVLDTIRREQTYLSITTLLEPSININSIIKIQSTVEPAFDGDNYGVLGFQHNGVISNAVSGEARSTFYLLKPEFGTYTQVQSQ